MATSKVVFPYCLCEEFNDDMFTSLWAKWPVVGTHIFKNEVIHTDELDVQTVVRMENRMPLANYADIPWFNIVPTSVLISNEYRRVLSDVIDISIGKKTSFDIPFPPDSHEDPFTKTTLSDIDNAFNSFLALCDETPLSRIAVVTSQRSSGKTLWLYFVIILRILAGQSTILETDNTVVAFTAQGFFRFAPMDPIQFSQFFAPGTWYCYDTNAITGNNQRPLYHSCKNFFFLQTTSPGEDRWNNWTYTSGLPSFIYYMQPLSISEIVIANAYQQHTNTIKEIQANYLVAGPIPTQLYFRDTVEIIRTIDYKFILMTLEELAELFITYDTKAISPELHLILPHSNRRRYEVTFVSQYVWDKALKLFHSETVDNQTRLCERLRLFPSTERVAERFLESMHDSG
ncbi:hypothetical protein ABKN59_005869 [Abortiporus biennis]